MTIDTEYEIIETQSLKEAERTTLRLLGANLEEDPSYEGIDDKLFHYLEIVGSTELAGYVYDYYGLGGRQERSTKQLAKESAELYGEERPHQFFTFKIKGMMQAAIILNPGVYFDACGQSGSDELSNLYTTEAIEVTENTNKSQRNKWNFINGMVTYMEERTLFERNFRKLDGYCQALFPDRWNRTAMRSDWMRYYALGRYSRVSPQYLRTGILDFGSESTTQQERDSVFNHIEGVRAATEILLDGTHGERYWNNSRGETRQGYRKDKLGSYVTVRVAEHNKYKALSDRYAEMPKQQRENQFNKFERDCIELSLDSKLRTGEFIEGDSQFEAIHGTPIPNTYRADILRLLDPDNEIELTRFQKLEYQEVITEMLGSQAHTDSFISALEDITSEYHTTIDGGYDHGRVYELTDHAINNIRRFVHKIMFGITDRVERTDIIPDVMRSTFATDANRQGLLEVVRLMATDRYRGSLPELSEHLTDQLGYTVTTAALFGLRKLALEVMKISKIQKQDA